MSDSECPEPDADVAACSPSALAERIRAGESVRLLDVRDRDEVAAWAIDGPSVERTQVPVARFMQADATDTVDELARQVDAEVAGDGPITAICARGEASAYVADLLDRVGLDARNLAEGMDGWARVYEARELDVTFAGSVLQYRRPSSGCLSYLVVAGNEAAVIDPLRAFTDRYVADAEARGARLGYAIDTHVHADHVSGVRRLAAETDARAVVPAGAVDRGLADIGDPAATSATPATDDDRSGSARQSTTDYLTIEDGDHLALGATTIEAIGAPGHTSEHTAFRVGGVVFTGDALFLDGVSRPDLEAGVTAAKGLAERLHHTLTQRFAPLPDTMTIAPSHHATDAAIDAGAHVAPLGVIRDHVSAFTTDRASFVDAITRDLGARPQNYERIVAINLGRESVPDETAFELELGPNNCAASTN